MDHLRRFALGLPGILALAAVLRLLCFTGAPGIHEEYTYVHHAFLISQGRNFTKCPECLEWNGELSKLAWTRVAHLVPIAAMHRLFGPAIWASSIPALIFSLAGIAFLYALLRETCDFPTAKIGALLLALFPMDLHFATRAQPDFPCAVLFLGAVLWWFRYLRQPDSVRPLIWAGLLLSLSYLAKETVLFGVFVMAALAVHSRRYHLRLLVPGLILMTVVLLECAMYRGLTGDFLYRFHAATVTHVEKSIADGHFDPSFIGRLQLIGKMLFSPSGPSAASFGVYAPLCLIAAGGCLVRRALGARPFLLWGAVMGLCVLFFPIRVWPRYIPALPVVDRYFFAMIYPGAAVVAIFLMSLKRIAFRAAVLGVVAVTSLACAYSLTAAQRMRVAGAREAARFLATTRDGLILTDWRMRPVFFMATEYDESAVERLRLFREVSSLPPDTGWIAVNHEHLNFDQELIGLPWPPLAEKIPGSFELRIRYEPSGRISLRDLIRGRVRRIDGARSRVEVFERVH